MPGYVINLGGAGLEGRLTLYIESGIYGTRIGRTGWYPAPLYTLCDYLTMRPGDLVFFFQKRVIYGVGTIVGIEVDTNERCIFSNFHASYLPTNPSSPPYLWDGDADPQIRWRVLFRPSPAFFHAGVDMDEVLQADSAGVARSLRVFWNRSFIKMEDDETHLLATSILRRNETPGSATFADDSAAVHQGIRQLPNLAAFVVDPDDLVHHDMQGGVVSHETTLQAWLVDGLTRRVREVTNVFGDWSYVSNKYPASPLKPRDYMDEIDVFGYVMAPAQEPIPRYISKFKIIEVKVEDQGLAAANVIDQVMKYVDWVSATRAGGDYGLIDSYVLAGGFATDLIEYAKDKRVRTYVIPRRPYETRRWESLYLVRYEALTALPSVRLGVALQPGP